MNTSSLFRLSLLAAVFGAALSAHAADAYSNTSGPYNIGGYLVAPSQTIGYQFMSGLTGSLTGFSVAINSDEDATNIVPFTLSLYADDSGVLGAALGSFSGTTNQYFLGATGLTTVNATGPTLSAGSKYWLVASSSMFAAWNTVDRTTSQPGYRVVGGGVGYDPAAISGAFSVQVNAVPEPATMAVLGAGALGLLRRRRKA